MPSASQIHSEFSAIQVKVLSAKLVIIWLSTFLNLSLKKIQFLGVLQYAENENTDETCSLHPSYICSQTGSSETEDGSIRAETCILIFFNEFYIL